MQIITKSHAREESRVRRLAAKRGYRLFKSRIRNPNLDNMGGYMILDPWTNTVAAGAGYDLELSAAAEYLADVLPDNSLN